MGDKRPGATTRWAVREVVDGASHARPDTVVSEEPLEIRLGWPGRPAERISVTMRTPGADFELAAGFLMSEGVIGPADRPRRVAYCVDARLTREQLYNVVTVELQGPPRRSPPPRASSISSACGVCGTQSLDAIFHPDETPVPQRGTIPADRISRLPEALADVQPVFSRTGALHAAGIFTFDADLVVAREDIGRHNAVDKVLGSRLLGSSTYGSDSILCVSGRIGFDIVTKAVVGRVGVIVAVGGPSSLALELADRAGVTVCGFTRDRRYVIYTHPERIAPRPAHGEIAG